MGALPWMRSSHDSWMAPMNHGRFVLVEQHEPIPNGISLKEGITKYKKVECWEVIINAERLPKYQDTISKVRKA